MIRIWRTGWASRLALSALVATQILIGGDVYFIQTHAMVRSPIKKVNDLLSSGYEKRYDERLDVFKGWTRARDAIPEDAHVMLHDNHVHLGLSRATTSDWGAWQFGISYGRLQSPAELWDLYRELGVTHLLWEDRTSKGWDSIAGDLVFFDFAINRTSGKKSVGNLRMGAMTDERPSSAPYGRVAYIGCGNAYATGLYDLSQMTTPVFGPEKENFAAPVRSATLEDVTGILDEASFVVLDPDCARKLSTDVTRAGFVLGASRLQINPGRKTKLQLYVKPSPSRR